MAAIAAMAEPAGLAAGATASPLPSGASAAPVPLASDLQNDSRQAARAGEPLVLFFSLPDCRYCHTVRHNYLAPLLRSLGAPVIREIEIASSRPVAGQGGAATTHAALAQRFGVRFAPTVLFVGPSGEPLAPPLLGGDTAGMYGAYLDARLATARQAASSHAASGHAASRQTAASQAAATQTAPGQAASGHAASGRAAVRLAAPRLAAPDPERTTR
ncbi:hypothetical protein ASC94_03710 [Massilia sp. Root418]|uniref:thioredoxin family protein n=1 Tax=Massilia sp. Root418 TaxID=1736532 RepID=UPI0006FE7C20|nr:thioredoxin fold domain-containing protein [Massilia sp. Root418]KQX01722.1 hypothetical protein ASC94_03710 [Massilia sp. Root418]